MGGQGLWLAPSALIFISFAVQRNLGAWLHGLFITQPQDVLTQTAVQVLVEKARTEAEEAQRILLAALNGLAGLMILDSDRPQAVALYRQAWHSA